jgi:hypothetical protein
LMLATTIHESNTTPHHQAGQQHTPRSANRGLRACCLRTQQCAWQSSLAVQNKPVNHGNRR